MKVSESEMAPSVAGQSLKMCLPGRERGRRACECNPRGSRWGGMVGK